MCVCVCAAISHLYISIHLYICICDVCIHIRTIDRASFYSVRFSFVLLSSSYLLANLISNKIICSICGCFYSVCILFCCDCYSVQRLQFRCISNVFLLSRKHNRWVRVEFRTLLYDANRKAKQKKMFISNEIHTLSAMVRAILPIWTEIHRYVRKLKLNNILATLHLICQKFHWLAGVGLRSCGWLALKSINPSHM